MAPESVDLRELWGLDRSVTFLNHGSFGACPRAVLEAQQVLRQQLEHQPVRFMVRELEARLDAARAELAAFVGAQPADLVFVANATSAVNAVLRSLDFEAGDELLTTDHAYNACRNVLEFAAQRCGARVVVAAVPFPLHSPGQIVDAVMAAVTARTKLLLVDHVSSPTAIIFPVAELVRQLSERGIDTLIDGAHAPGMIDLDVGAIGAAYYTGNCHKWMCAPKGSGFLVVQRERQKLIRPAVISHGANSPRTDRSRYLIEFDWTGSIDPTAYLTIPAALRCMEEIGLRLSPSATRASAWKALREHNHSLALAARNILCGALGIEPSCPHELLGSMATIALPAGPAHPTSPPLYLDPLQDRLLVEHGIEVPVFAWPRAPRRWLRVSAQAYNRRSDYEELAAALRIILNH